MRTHVLCGVTLLCACASSTPAPRSSESVATAMASARGAEVAGAQELPEAALYLKLANEEIDRARMHLQQGNEQRAAYLSARAKNDADLALALAREDAARRRAQHAAMMARSRSSRFAGTPQTPPLESPPMPSPDVPENR